MRFVHQLNNLCFRLLYDHILIGRHDNPNKQLLFVVQDFILIYVSFFKVDLN